MTVELAALRIGGLRYDLMCSCEVKQCGMVDFRKGELRAARTERPQRRLTHKTHSDAYRAMESDTRVSLGFECYSFLYFRTALLHITT